MRSSPWPSLRLMWRRVWWTRYERYVAVEAPSDVHFTTTPTVIRSYDADWHLIHEREALVADTVSAPGSFSTSVHVATAEDIVRANRPRLM